MNDYNPGDLLVDRVQGTWQVTGLFDLMEYYFGDGEADLMRLIAIYLEQNQPQGVQLAGAFASAYLTQKPARESFAERYALSMLRDRLIVYRHGQRTRDEIAAEWRFVDYLAQNAVPVAPAIATTTGEQLMTLQAPEGVRSAVVTSYAPGQHLRRRPSAEATRRYGTIIATIHVLADQAPVSLARATPDIAAWLDQALLGIRAILGDGLTERAYLEQCAQELQARLQGLPREAPAYGIIHGDAIRANALVGDDGSVTVIDFDWYGQGWRAYDLASYLLTVRGGPNEQAFAEAFLSGYTAVRPLAAHEPALLPLFEAVRAILEIGTPALHVNLWGSAYLESFFAQSLERLKRSMQQLAEGYKG